MLGGEERRRGRSGRPAAEAARQARTRASRATRPWRKSLVGVVGGGLAGFLLGAAFWIVLGLQELSSGGAPRLMPSGEPHGVFSPTPGCTALALDRRQGHTTAEPCLGQVLPLREASITGPGHRSLP